MRRIASLFIALFSAMSFASGGNTAEIARLREAADSLHSVGRTDSAAVVGEKAILLADKAGDPVQIVGTNAAQGVFLRSLGRIDEALKNMRRLWLSSHRELSARIRLRKQSRRLPRYT